MQILSMITIYTLFVSTLKSFRELQKHLPPSLEELVKKDLEEYKKKQEEKAAVVTTTEEKVDDDGNLTTTTTTTTTTTKVESVVVKKGGSPSNPGAKAAPEAAAAAAEKPTSSIPSANGTANPVPIQNAPEPAPASQRTCRGRTSRAAPARGDNYGDTPDASTQPKGKVNLPQESSDKAVIGLRVYTNKDVTCSVEGRLRTGCKDPNCKNCAPPTTVTIPAVATETTTTTIVAAG